jgi:hypothetical protein
VSSNDGEATAHDDDASWASPAKKEKEVDRGIGKSEPFRFLVQRH